MLNSLKLFGFIYILSIIHQDSNSQQVFTFDQIGCNFETDQSTCNWQPTPSSSPWTWKSTPTRSIQFNGALQPVTGSGHFIQVYSQASADLVSPLLAATSATNCFTFYYYIHGVGVGTIQLQIMHSDSKQTLWDRKYSAGDMWHKYSVTIGPQQSNFNLILNADAGTGAIALDEFVGTAGQCEQSSLCDFESGACNWTASTAKPNYMFKLIQAGDGASPDNKFDHSTDSAYGHFMEASGGNANDVTTLTSPKLFDGANYCLKFWYWRHVSSANQIEVHQTGPMLSDPDTIIWKSNYSYPNKVWHRAVANFFSWEDEQIIIKLIRAGSETSIIDIDDISLEPQKCPVPIDCDFNRDMCGWTTDNTLNWLWDHGFGRLDNAQQSDVKYPLLDRRAPTEGMFIFSDFTQLNSDTQSTMVMNSEYIPATTASCFTFYYVPLSYNDPSNVFKIVLLDETGATISTPFTYDYQSDPLSKSGANKHWVNKSIDISSTKSFRISIVLMTTKAATYMAIDDITYRAGSCAQKPPEPTRHYIPTDAPGKSLNCQFKSKADGACIWAQDQVQPWQFMNGKEVKNSRYKYLPYDDTDHNFAYVAHDSGDPLVNKRAVMTATDNAVPGYKGPVCFYLYYWMQANGQAQFNISVRSPQNVDTMLITRSDDHGQQWNLLMFDTVENSTGYTYTISGQVSYGTIAIDVIYTYHDSCSGAYSEIYEKCTFESGHNCSFAPVYHPDEKKLFFTLYKGSETVKKTNDHTYKSLFGHYYALDFDYLNQIGYWAVDDQLKILSRTFRPTKGACVTFSYYMYGLENNETLNVYIQKENSVTTVPLWKASGNLGPFWYSHRMTVNSTLNWQLAFDVHTYRTQQGLIAIDDVAIEIDVGCPARWRCDFELRDTCMWESIPPNSGKQLTLAEKQKLLQLQIGTQVDINQLTYSDFEWIVFSNEVSNSLTNGLYPITDHTLNRKTGNYLLLRTGAPRKQDDRAVLVSDHYDTDPNNISFCLSLFYVFKVQGTAHLAKYPRVEVFQSESYKQVTKIGEIVGSEKTLNWTEFKVTATPANSSSVNMWFYLVGSVGANNSIVAIDDISITSGVCAKANINFDCGPNESILKSKVCDGIIDCSNKADELNCGNCDFANGDSCGYTFDRVSGDDKSYHWRFGDANSGPKSAPDQTTDFIVASRSDASNMNALTATLMSPSISNSTDGCYLYVRYNLLGDTSRLSVQVDRSGEELIEVYNSDAVDVKRGTWIYGYATLERINTRFSVRLVASQEPSYNLDSYVAITSLDMYNCPMYNTYCTDKLFKCDNGNCISNSYVCDFTDNCGDNSDEKDSVCSLFKSRCNFEDGYCDWGQHKRDEWYLSRGYPTLLKGPTRDHTTGIGEGKFLIMRSSPTHDLTSTIDGPILEPGVNCTLTLFTSRLGNVSNIGNLTVQAENLNTRDLTNLWLSDPQWFPALDFMFERLSVGIRPQNGTFRLLLTGFLQNHGNSRMNSYIAVDDILLSKECILSTATLNTDNNLNLGGSGDGAKIAAGILVPIFVIGAAIIGYIFYKRYKQRQNDDGSGLANVLYRNEHTNKSDKD